MLYQKLKISPSEHYYSLLLQSITVSRTDEINRFFCSRAKKNVPNIEVIDMSAVFKSIIKKNSALNLVYNHFYAYLSQNMCVRVSVLVYSYTHFYIYINTERHSILFCIVYSYISMPTYLGLSGKWRYVLIFY